MSFLAAAQAVSGPTATSLVWVEIAVGIVALLGGAVGLWRWAKQQGARDAKIDQLIKAMRPNGLETDGVGDITKRTENAVNRLSRQLERHIGASDNEHKRMWRAIDQKQDKESV